MMDRQKRMNKPAAQASSACQEHPPALCVRVRAKSRSRERERERERGQDDAGGKRWTRKSTNAKGLGRNGKNKAKHCASLSLLTV